MAAPIDIGGIASLAGLDVKLDRDPGRIKEAAQQFEAILIQQLMKSAHAAGGATWMGEDESGSALSEMAEQQFARMLASGGGIGLAKLVAQGLERKP
jgi:flagellar protein FlgJ